MNVKRFEKVLYGVLVILCIVLLSVIPAKADKAYVTGTIDRIFLDDVNFGTCIVKISVNPKDILPACKDDWITFSCDGTFSSIEIANRKLKLAELSLALGTQVRLYVNDNKMHNGYCYAERIILPY